MDEGGPSNWYNDNNNSAGAILDEEARRIERRRRRRTLAATIATIAFMTVQPRTFYGRSELPGWKKVQEYMTRRPKKLFNKTRFTPMVFQALCSCLKEKGLLQASPDIGVEEQVMIFLTIVAQDQNNRAAQDEWDHSGETISRYFEIVLTAVCALRHDFIRDPNVDDVPQYITDNGHKYLPWFKNCVGAIDGTHIPCVPPADGKEYWRNRKGIYTQNCMAACDFDGKFTYFCSGWEGSVHDARVLKNVLDGPNADFTRPPNGKFYLVDSGYGNDVGFLAPFRTFTYHFEEFNDRREGLQGKEEVFNYTHSSLRNIIERTFGILKQRWHILNKARSYPYWKQVMIPIACAVLHNFLYYANYDPECLRMYLTSDSEDDDDSDEEDTDIDEDDGDNDDEDDGVDAEPQAFHETDASPEPVPQDRRHMGLLRDNLAQQMYGAFLENPWYRHEV